MLLSAYYGAPSPNSPPSSPHAPSSPALLASTTQASNYLLKIGVTVLARHDTHLAEVYRYMETDTFSQAST